MEGEVAPVAQVGALPVDLRVSGPLHGLAGDVACDLAHDVILLVLLFLFAFDFSSCLGSGSFSDNPARRDCFYILDASSSTAS